MWTWIIIAAVVIIGLVFWTKSKKKEEGVDISATSEETPAAPEAPEVSEPSSAEAPVKTSESSSEEEKPM
jgi:hypothetical protein